MLVSFELTKTVKYSKSFSIEIDEDEQREIAHNLCLESIEDLSKDELHYYYMQKTKFAENKANEDNEWEQSSFDWDGYVSEVK